MCRVWAWGILFCLLQKVIFLSKEYIVFIRKDLEFILSLLWRDRKKWPKLGIIFRTITNECVDMLFFFFFLQTLSTAAAAAKLLQSCPTLCDPIDGSPPGSPVPGILQARTLEWVAISFSNAWKWKLKVKSLSHVPLLDTPWTAAYQAPLPMGFSRQEYWSGVPLPSPIEYYFPTYHQKVYSRIQDPLLIISSFCNILKLPLTVARCLLFG